jgi:hypothetical protein
VTEPMTTEAAPAETRKPMEKRAAYFTFDDQAAETVGNLYYFAPLDRSPGPYRTQIHVTAIVDIAADGTLAGVELIDGMPPPPNRVTHVEAAPAELLNQVADQCRVVVHLLNSMAELYAADEKLFRAHSVGHATLADMIGKRSAELMEELGEHLNGMDAVGEDDEWTAPIFREAQRLFPRTPLNATPIVTGSELLTREEAESVYNALRHPLGITQFTGHSITLIREAVNIVLSARIPLYTQPQSQRIAELEAALKPFAAFAEKAENFVDAAAKFGGTRIFPTKDFRLSDFRRARELLLFAQDSGGV